MDVELLIKIAHYYEEKYDLEKDDSDLEPPLPKGIESLTRKEIHEQLNASINHINELLARFLELFEGPNNVLPRRLLPKFERDTIERLSDLPVFKINSAQEYEKKHPKISELRSKLEDLIKNSQSFDWFGRQDKDIEIESKKALGLLNKLEELLENEFGPELQEKFERQLFRRKRRHHSVLSPEKEPTRELEPWNCMD